jgi:hypothetical protein
VERRTTFQFFLVTSVFLGVEIVAAQRGDEGVQQIKQKLAGGPQVHLFPEGCKRCDMVWETPRNSD